MVFLARSWAHARARGVSRLGLGRIHVIFLTRPRAPVRTHAYVQAVLGRPATPTAVKGLVRCFVPWGVDVATALTSRSTVSQAMHDL